MSEVALLPGQVGVVHDLEVSVPPILKGRELTIDQIMMRANQVEHAVKVATGEGSWASGFGGSRDMSFRFGTVEQLTGAIAAASETLGAMGYPIETVTIPMDRRYEDDDAGEDNDEDPDPSVALLVIERDIPVGADGDRLAE